MSKNKSGSVSQSLSHWVTESLSEWQGHLLSCQVTAKNKYLNVSVSWKQYEQISQYIYIIKTIRMNFQICLYHKKIRMIIWIYSYQKIIRIWYGYSYDKIFEYPYHISQDWRLGHQLIDFLYFSIIPVQLKDLVVYSTAALSTLAKGSK